MPRRHKLFMATAMVSFMSVLHPAFAELEKKEQWQIDQQKSGENLLKFLFGDDEDAEEKEEDPAALPADTSTEIPVEDKSEQLPVPENNSTPVTSQPVPKAAPGTLGKPTLAPSTIVPSAPIVQEKLESPNAATGKAREGLVPPPGFNKSTGPDVKPETSGAVETQNSPQPKAQPKPPVTQQKNDIEAELARLSEESPVVAVVEGDEIYWEDIIQDARKLPEQYQGQLEAMLPILIDRAIDLKLLSQAGRDADVDEEDLVQRRLKQAEDRIIRDAFLDRKLEELITEDMLKQRYSELLLENVTNAEIRASHILVETRNEALALIIALDNGADFPLLAKKFSQGPSAEKGGDLGWFRQKDMDPEFATAAFGLSTGEFTRSPVATEFGWHVIRLEEKREVQQPAFEDMKEEIRGEVSRDLIKKMVRDLRKDADISVFPSQ
ncbi:peptidylprolyl isomerase [Kiloniella laminariae]|uniref:Parvulin-like PPIase n=1 Tax=Kiloniella laminariae TaxID=454162 RepID=A0ABT4LM36_9PROT|nr:peptidylprolyl isomerase [Kiloniella laminariae]MCZ4282169.1 peptidylprolyl isomerase [Kiloniella laminariae]